MPQANALPGFENAQIRPISDLRTHLSDIESAAQSGTPVIMNRNGKPVLLVLDFEAAAREREAERERQKIREAEIWDRASGSKRTSLADAVAALKADLDEFKQLGLANLANLAEEGTSHA